MVDKFKPRGASYDEYHEIAIQDNYLFVINEGFYDAQNELLIFDILGKKNLRSISKLTFPEELGHVFGMTFYNNYLFITCGFEGILVLDISNPHMPHQVAVYKADGNVFFNSPLLIKNGVGYVNEMFRDDSDQSQTRLNILSLDNLFAIKKISTLENVGIPLVIKNNYLYTKILRPKNQDLKVSNYLGILDISTSEKPVLVEEFFDINELQVAKIQDNKLYLGGNNLFYITDISNYTNPIVLGKIEVYADDIIIDKNYAYFLQTFYVGAIDISNPETPTLIGGDRIDQGDGFVFKNNFIYLVDRYYGVYTYKINKKVPSAFLEIASYWFQARNMLYDKLQSIIIAVFIGT